MNDHVAERQILGIALASGTVPAIRPDAWTDERHRLIAAVLAERDKRNIPIEPQGVAKAAMARAGTDQKAKQIADLVLTLYGQASPVAALPHYVERVTALAAVRNAKKSALRFAQYCDSADLDDEDRFATELGLLRDSCDETAVSFKATSAQPPMSLAELLDGTEAYDWLIPDLLERTDRVMLVAPEGVGKTELLSQVAVTVAAGLHPFLGDPLPPGEYRVLVVDCENSRRQLRRRFRRLAGQVDNLVADAGLDPVDWSTRLRFVIRPEGVSLTDPRELSRMEQAVAAAQPDLIVIGPLYRLSKVDVRDEQAAKELTDCIDLIRVRHQVAVMAETHAGHGQNGAGMRALRPLGSSLFLRWPEFGLAMRPHSDCVDEEHPSLMNLVSWRGARDERNWPRMLRHGKRLPWEPANDDYYDLPRTP